MKASKTSTRGFRTTASAPKKKNEIMKKESEQLEQEALKLEEQFNEMKQMVMKSNEQVRAGGWANATKEVPMRGYAKYVLEKQQKDKALRQQTSMAFPKPLGESGRKAEEKSAAVPPKMASVAPVQKAAANFAKAKVDEAEFKELETFLSSINLIKYKDAFIDNGLEDLESIMELRDEHFQTMGIPLGHKLKMLKRIRELRPPSDIPPSNPPKRQEVGDKASVECEFNEEEGHKQFLEAREAWLKEGKQQKAEPSAKPVAEKPGKEKMDAGVGEEQKSEPGGIAKLLLEAGGDSWNVNCMPEYADGETNMSPKNADTDVSLKKTEARECCFGCYKLFDKVRGLHDQTIHKTFCSEKCFEKYFKDNSLVCSNGECGKRFLNEASGTIKDSGTWFCSQKCCEEERKKIAETIKEEKPLPMNEKEIEEATDEMLKLGVQ